METYRYHLTDARLRAQTDLRNYKNEILQGVHKVDPNAKVKVLPKHFKIRATKLKLIEKQAIGKNIARNFSKASNPIFPKVYFYNNGNGISKQLFKSIK